MREQQRRQRRFDAARHAAFQALHRVTVDGAYANLAVHEEREKSKLNRRDAGFVTELVNGTCRGLGTYDEILEAASGRELCDLEAEVVDILRLAAHQILGMRVPEHAAVAASVDLAALEIGERATGIVNAVTRKVAARDFEAWIDVLEPEEGIRRTSLATCHPEWIVRAYMDVLPADEVAEALAANNVAPAPTLVIRPGLAEVEELGEPTRWSPYGATSTQTPGQIAAVRERRAGVQDEGSQLTAQLLAEAPGPAGPWLDMCAGPGGKTALLWGLADVTGETLLASELHFHRAKLVAQACAGYEHPPAIVCADALTPPWSSGHFAKVMLDAPCSGLGSLRRRPESRWRRAATDVNDLIPRQRKLLAGAIEACAPGGLVAYVTCSPHAAETVGVTQSVLVDYPNVSRVDVGTLMPHIPGATRDGYLQLWPHRHGTDAMFCALLRVG